VPQSLQLLFQSPCWHLALPGLGPCRTPLRQDFVAEAGASRKSVGPWGLFCGT
jgi:hypothetical protein